MIDEIYNQSTKVLEYRDKSIRIVDSIPVLVYKFGRAYFHKLLRLMQPMGIVLSKNKLIMDLNYMSFSSQLAEQLNINKVLTNLDIEC